jgi:hypothetical protein
MKSLQLLTSTLLLTCALAMAQRATFSVGVYYPTNTTQSTAIVVADLNGDGKPDLVVGSTSNVSVLLGNGDGTFQPAITYTGAVAKNSLAVVDMNGDGKLDLVAGNPNAVNVFLGNGDGTFQAAKVTNVANSALAVADVNHDGIPDVVLASAGVAVLLGNGDGSFQTPVVTSTVNSPAIVAVADLNHDGKPDAVIVTFEGYLHDKEVDHATVGVMFGNGDGTFQQPTSYDTGGFTPEQITISDLNLDGSPDIVVVDYRGKNPFKGLVGLLFNNGAGVFSAPEVLQFAGNAYGVAVGPVNGSVTPGVLILETHKPLLWGIQTSHLFGYEAAAAVIADVNGDGQPDVVFAGACLPGTCTGGAAVVVLSSDVDSKTALTSSLNPSQSGQAVTFTAQTSSSRGPAPGGIVVTFFDGSHEIGTAVTTYGIGASLTTSALTAGTHSIKADFPGCPYVKQSKGTIKQVVNT